jgi:hypothetical protein
MVRWQAVFSEQRSHRFVVIKVLLDQHPESRSFLVRQRIRIAHTLKRQVRKDVILHNLRVDVVPSLVQGSKHDEPVLPAICPKFKRNKTQRYNGSCRGYQFTYIRKIVEIHACLRSWLVWRRSISEDGECLFWVLARRGREFIRPFTSGEQPHQSTLKQADDDSNEALAHWGLLLISSLKFGPCHAI